MIASMSDSDFQVTVAQASPSELRGRIADDDSVNAWIRAGADVRIQLNPPRTAFSDPAILGSGRIYDDRIEIDLVLAPATTAKMLAVLERSYRPGLRFSANAITESIFRVEDCAAI
jgi:hypothetical protein